VLGESKRGLVVLVCGSLCGLCMVCRVLGVPGVGVGEVGVLLVRFFRGGWALVNKNKKKDNNKKNKKWGVGKEGRGLKGGRWGRGGFGVGGG